MLNASRLLDKQTDVWMLSHLIPFNDSPRLKAYQAQVTEYPETLRRSVIENKLRGWRWMMGVADVFLGEPVARRGNFMICGGSS
ncbi:MAG TPA: hypothetical protein VHL11_04235 [Phototrophicaceae bacterium]|nr:hypothetical protein [Phototrophicaceae bacterium]